MTAYDTYVFITQQFRFGEASDQGVRTTYPLARTVEVDGRLTNLTDAQAVAATLLDLLKAPRFLFEVPVLGVNVMTLSMLDGQTPTMALTSDRFGLSAGRLVLVPEFSIQLGQGQTTLKCWG